MTVKLHTPEQVAKHNSAKSCWVIVDGKVYDVTEFIRDHPGGDDLILEYAGKDVSAIMRDVLEHAHSDAAYEILNDYCVGALTNSGAATAADDGEDDEDYTNEDFHPRETDLALDAKKNQFLDLRKPLIPQMLRSNFTKEFYLEQVHKPRYLPYSAQFFGHPLLEPLSKTAWYVVPIVWLPVVAYNLKQSLDAGHMGGVSALSFALGVFIWSLLEYGLHRFLFHVDNYLPDHQIAFTLHFTLHGFHHYLPMDRLRLVMPPALNVFISYPLTRLGHALFPPAVAYGVIAGGFFGYILYDCVHYYLHHAKVFEFHFKEMKKYHLAHHYKDFDLGYGITSKFWDYVFRTVLEYKEE
ncbi:hypothetical protein BX666DRAFT_1887762 [Dichotomocladium elegans]|nr:hypothetical protein BX666DRAFT_1887762 [Dichotomocladium elegans]